MSNIYYDVLRLNDLARLHGFQVDAGPNGALCLRTAMVSPGDPEADDLIIKKETLIPCVSHSHIFSYGKVSDLLAFLEGWQSCVAYAATTLNVDWKERCYAARKRDQQTKMIQVLAGTEELD